MLPVKHFDETPKISTVFSSLLTPCIQRVTVIDHTTKTLVSNLPHFKIPKMLY